MEQFCCCCLVLRVAAVVAAVAVAGVVTVLVTVHLLLIVVLVVVGGCGHGRLNEVLQEFVMVSRGRENFPVLYPNITVSVMLSSSRLGTRSERSGQKLSEPSLTKNGRVE